jgi:predicted dehydrogenase
MTVGVAIVGAGFGRRVQLPAFGLLKETGVEVRHLVTHDWAEAVVDDEVQLVSVATPPPAHAEIALAALAAGKAVLCEKPLAATLPDAEEMAAAAELAAVPTLVDFEFRALPPFARAKELLAQQAIGKVVRADVEWRLATRLAGPLAPSWKDAPGAGGGALAALGVHAFDYVEWLLGPVERLRARLDEEPGRSENGFEAVLELAGGVQVSLVVSTVAEVPTGHAIRIQGETGTLTLTNPELDDFMRGFRLDLHGRTLVPPAGGEVDGRIAPFAELARSLVDAIRADDRCTPSFAEGLRAQQLLEAAVRSSAADGPVTAGARPDPQV